MLVERIAAFSEGNSGGNPAGVVICDTMPTADVMQKVASDVGYSETVFAAKEGDFWRARFFSPAFEVDFCGHATIALGAVLATRFGDGIFQLKLNKAQLAVEGSSNGRNLRASLDPPPTHSKKVSNEVLVEALTLFSLSKDELNSELPPAIAHGGNDHLILSVLNRIVLGSMDYDFKQGADFMRANNFATISLVYIESPQVFHTRNAFAIGGVFEDPATGAAAAALAGYLRDINWDHGGSITIVQGEDMGSRSCLQVSLTDEAGSSVRVCGNARFMI
jgi:PhzF family phenazine biosynthesis protein